MANNQGPLSKDYSLLLDFNFDLLNNRPALDAKSLFDENVDWYLIEFLHEMELMGISSEQTLNALLTMIGGLSNDSFCRNLLTGAPVGLNIISHILGTTGSNKSYLANEIIYALKTLDDKYPNIYSNRPVSNDIDHIEEQPKKKQKSEQWNFLASSITEAALSKNTNYTDVMIVNPDGDNALKLLSYYEQNSMGGAQGVSSFCTGYDGIEPGSSRVTGVETSRNDRKRPSKLSMYIVSTGKKLSTSLMKMVEEGANDGVYGRVWYTHTNTVRELPDILKQKQTSLPNITHIAMCCHHFFQNRTIEFRYGLFRSDVADQPQGHISGRMQAARRRQNVNLPEFYGVAMDERDIIQQQPPISNNTNDDSLDQLSPFELASRYTNEVWNESFTLETHVGQMWRKISYHLPKAIATIKILRLFFRLMGNDMLYYLNSQEGSRSYPSKAIRDTFYQKLNQVFNDYFEQCSRTSEMEKKKINVLLFTSDDVQIGYRWCRWKLETTSNLFSTAEIQNIINARLGKPSKPDLSSNKTMAQRRMDDAMTKVLMTPVIFFTNSYLSTNTLRGGSGLFMQKRSTDLKYDVVVENLLAKDFVVKCNVIQGARSPKNNNLSSSYYKQQPSYFEQSELRMKELQDMGINFTEYKRTYENSSLPKNTHFNNDGIELIKADGWIPFYHTFLSDPMAKLMIQKKVEINQIIEYDGRFGLNNSNANVIVSGGESNEQQIEESFHMNSVDFNIISTQSNFLAVPSRALSIRTTNELQMEGETFQNNKKMKLCFGTENVEDIFHDEEYHLSHSFDLSPIGSFSRQNNMEEGDSRSLHASDANFHLPSHSTPIHNNAESSLSALLPVDHVTSPSRQSNNEEVVMLSSVVDNACRSPLINQSCSIQSMSTILPPPMESTSSSSINKIIEILNSSSIQLGSTDPDPVYIIQHHQKHQNKQPHIDDVIVDIVENLVSVISTEVSAVVDVQSKNSTTIKKRGRRPSLKSTTRPSITASEIANVVENDNHPIWKKLILNKHVLASMSDLSRTVTGSDEINAARLKCIEKLLNIGCFLNGDEFLNGKERAVLKNSPEDPRLISALNKYGIDMDEYKQSFNNQNPFGYKNGVPVPALLDISTNKNKFTSIFVDKIQSDPFFSVYLRIDPEHVEKSSSLKRKTTSSHETDLFRKQKQQKTRITKVNAEKIIEQLVNRDGETISNKKGVRTRRTASNR